MTDNFNLSTVIDYTNGYLHYSMLSAITPVDLANTTIAIARTYDTDGVIIHQAQLTKMSGQPHTVMFVGSGQMGLTFPTLLGGYDAGIMRTDTSGVYVSDLYTNWHLSADAIWDATFPGLSAVVGSIETYSNESPYLNIDSRDNKYLDTPLLITRGDPVTYGSIATVSGLNYVSLTYDKQVASYTGYNITNSVCQIISGAHSGQCFSITSHTLGQSGFYVDKDCSSYSGEVIKIMPYRTVTSYSGWDYCVSGQGNKGSNGINSRFGLSSTIPNKVGSLYYTAGAYAGTDTTFHPNLPLYALVPCSKVFLSGDIYGRDIQIGDLVYYNPSTDLGATYTGAILSVTSASSGTYASYWPRQQPHASSTYTVYRSPDILLQTYPKLNTTYLSTATPLSGVNNAFTIELLRHQTNPFSCYSTTPGASVEFSANEFESLFTLVNETANFHIGPIHLTNGQMLDDSRLDPYTNGYLPKLHFTSTVYQGDPTNPTTAASSSGFSTRNSDAAHLFNGTYFQNGVYTHTASSTFTASETLICVAEVRYGAIKIQKTFTLPVQPAV